MNNDQLADYMAEDDSDFDLDSYADMVAAQDEDREQDGE